MGDKIESRRRLREGYKNATAYIPVKGHYGRSYTADRW